MRLLRLRGICLTTWHVLAVRLCVVAGFLAGCGGRYTVPERMDEGLVMILPGVEGPSPLNIWIRRGLWDAGRPEALVIHDWHRRDVGISYPYRPKAVKRSVDGIVQRVCEYRSEHPARPVFLIGHSGGGAMAVFAAERFTGGKPLDGVILLAAALGPKYDVSRAIQGCGGRMVNCYSRRDLLLRTLTSAGRNFDGSRGHTAGQDGFELPPDADAVRREAFRRMDQISWEPDMHKYGHFGGHTHWSSPRWVKAYLAPLLELWTAEAVSTSDGPA